MNLDFTPAEDEFRDQAATWLRENLPTEERPPNGQPMREFDLAWQQTLHAGGWAGINWPKEYGGRGLSDIEQMIWYTEFAKADPPFTLNNSCTFVGNNHGGPTLIVNGDDEQKSTHLPRILRGESVWCQGFSEPGAGSDLGSLSCKAVIDGDELVVNGQKIWTSYADVADFQELLVRTDPDAPKHKGISWVICDMTYPGIDIRPIETMSHTTDFAEVFYDDVRIPLTNVVGELNDGWRVTNVTLSFERGTAFVSEMLQSMELLEDLAAVAKQTGRWDDAGIRRELGHLAADLDALWALTKRNVSQAARTGVPGVGGSVFKLHYSEVRHRLGDLAMRILDRASMSLDDRHVDGEIHAISISIAAGTSQIQRNIVAERVLGLPREPAWTSS